MEDAFPKGFLRFVAREFLTIQGRAGRGTFWKFVLLYGVLRLATSMLDTHFHLYVYDDSSGRMLFGICEVTVSCLFLLPGICISVRRLHDVGLPGFLLLAVIVPWLGVPGLLICMLLKGRAGTNAYGPNPAEAGEEPSGPAGANAVDGASGRVKDTP